MIDMLERRGVISGYEGSKPRQVLDHRGRPAARAGGAGRRRRARRVRRGTPERLAFPRGMPEIGETLREARMRARIDVSEIEAQTKIRAKYLRALENEEWGLLPGPTFVKSFLRTYAAGARPRRQGARRGVPPAPREPERRACSSRSSPRPAARAVAAAARRAGRARGPGGGPSRGYLAIVGVDRRADRAADRRPARPEVVRPSGIASTGHRHRPRRRHAQRTRGKHATRRRATPLAASAIVALSLTPPAPSTCA